MNVLVITPTYNERKNIVLLIEKILRKNPKYHLLVVDDNSPDGTGQIVKKMQNKYNHLFIEEREKKSGLGTAYIHGFNWALKKDYDYIVQIDADLSHNPDDIPKLVKRLENNQEFKIFKNKNSKNKKLLIIFLLGRISCSSVLVLGIEILFEDIVFKFLFWKFCAIHEIK